MILRNALTKFAEEKYDSVQFYLTGVCEQAVKTAIDARLSDPRARDFTGNLINSIACALYRDGKLVHVTYSKDEIASPIRRKMTYPKVYTFKPGWDDEPVVHFVPEIKTGEKSGGQDALEFIKKFKADKKAKLELVFAYTTEYASYVEAARGTTGYLWATEYIRLEAPKAEQYLK